MSGHRRIAKWLLGLVLFALVPSLVFAKASPAKELGVSGAAQGVITTESGDDNASYRYVTVNPRTKPTLTIVERIDVGDGAIDRWWYLPGSYVIPAVAYDGSAGGLSGNGNALALVRFTRTYPPRRTKLAILDTDVYLRHPRKPRQLRPQHAISYLNLPGYFYFQAISPNGSKIYLRRYRTHGRGSDDFGLGVLNTRGGRLTRRPLAVSNNERPLSGLPISGATSPDGRWAYALYDGDRHMPFLLALDTTGGRVIRVNLPGLERLVANPYMLKLRVNETGGRLSVYPRSPQSGRVPARTQSLLSVNVAKLTHERRSPGAKGEKR